MRNRFPVVFSLVGVIVSLVGVMGERPSGDFEGPASVTLAEGACGLGSRGLRRANLVVRIRGDEHSRVAPSAGATIRTGRAYCAVRERRERDCTCAD